jgi:hypothetical protein
MKNRIQLSTTSYQFAHGKTPRGFGNWLIEINGAVHQVNCKVSEITKNIAKLYPGQCLTAIVLS